MSGSFRVSAFNFNYRYFADIDTALRTAVTRDMFEASYSDVFAGDAMWQSTNSISPTAPASIRRLASWMKGV